MSTTAIHDNRPGEIVAIAAKTVPVDDDVFVMEDSADGDEKKSLKYSDLQDGLIIAQSQISDSLVIITVTIMGDDTDLAVAVAERTFRMPLAMTLTDIRVSLKTAPTGAIATFDLNESGSTVLSTKVTIDEGGLSSVGATTPPVISDSALADDAQMTIDIDTIGTTIPGGGAIMYLIGEVA